MVTTGTCFRTKSLLTQAHRPFPIQHTPDYFLHSRYYEKYQIRRTTTYLEIPLLVPRDKFNDAKVMDLESRLRIR